MTATINASTSAGVVTTADTSGILQLQTNGTAALTVDASQNVGIGTASPAYKLDVVTSSNPNFIRTGVTGTNAGAGVIFQGAVNTRNNWVIANQYNVSGALEFTQTTAAGGSTIGATPSMLIDRDGNLLVGTTNTSVYNQNSVNGIGIIPGTSSGIQIATDPAGSTGNASIILNMRNTPINGSKYIRFFEIVSYPLILFSLYSLLSSNSNGSAINSPSDILICHSLRIHHWLHHHWISVHHRILSHIWIVNTTVLYLKLLFTFSN
jgi:hypothetical protein